MQKNILYIGEQATQRYFIDFLVGTGAVEVRSLASFCYRLELDPKIPLLDKVVFDFITDLGALPAYMKLVKADLILYDERGSKAPAAITAVKKIDDHINQLSKVWGPDFIFPMSRVFIVTKKGFGDRFVFDLGRLHIGDVIDNPQREHEIYDKLLRYFNRRSQLSQDFGIALSGGGIEGFLFQIGALYALEKALGKRKLHNAKVISGVSSGSIAGAILAAKANISEMIKAITGTSELYGKFKTSMIFDIATKDIASRIVKQQMSFTSLMPSQLLRKFLKSVPVGFFKGSTLEKYFETIMETTTCKNKFSRLDTDLLIGATDHDTFKHVIFGDEGTSNVPISKAIRASCSLPPFFTPVKIDDRYYIDGQITKSCDLELCIEKGSRLCFILDPLTPYTNDTAGISEAEGGFYTSLQVVKSVMSSRFEETLRHVTERFPQVDFVIIQPDEVCGESMRGSPMRFKLRTKIIEQAFKGTLKTFSERHSVYSTTFAKYGFELKSVDKLKQYINEGYPF